MVMSFPYVLLRNFFTDLIPLMALVRKTSLPSSNISSETDVCFMSGRDSRIFLLMTPLTQPSLRGGVLMTLFFTRNILAIVASAMFPAAFSIRQSSNECSFAYRAAMVYGKKLAVFRLENGSWVFLASG